MRILMSALLVSFTCASLTEAKPRNCQAPDEKAPDYKALSNKAPDYKALSNKAPGDKAPDDKALSNKAPDDKAPDYKTLSNKAQDDQALQDFEKTERNRVDAVTTRSKYYTKFLKILEHAVPSEAETLRSTGHDLKQAYKKLKAAFYKVSTDLRDTIIKKTGGKLLPLWHKAREISGRLLEREQNVNHILNNAFGEYEKPKNKSSKQPLLISKKEDKTTKKEDKNFQSFINFVKLITDIFPLESLKLVLKGEEAKFYTNDHLKRVQDIIKRLNEEILPKLADEHKYVVDKDFLKTAIKPTSALLKKRDNAKI